MSAGKSSSITLVDYSEKSIAIFDADTSWNESFKELHGRWNGGLVHEGVKRGGWIFSSAHRQDLEDLVVRARNGEGPPPKSNVATKNIYIEPHDEGRIAVYGDTIKHKDNIKKMGGVFCPSITDPRTGRKAGWIFREAQKSMVALYIDTGKMPNDAINSLGATDGVCPAVIPLNIGDTTNIMGVIYQITATPRKWLCILSKSPLNTSDHSKEFPAAMHLYYVPSEGGWIVDPAVMSLDVYSKDGQNRPKFS